MRDVALKAGVSAATVSHVLNGTRAVHEATVKRVHMAIDELDYRPNLVARSLRRKETRTIGLLVSDIETAFFPEMTHAIEQVASSRDYSVILGNTGEDPLQAQRYVDLLLTKQVDGIIMAPPPGSDDYLRDHLRRGAKIVLINRYHADLPCPAVTSNDEEAAFELTNAILANGHRHIGAAIWLEGIPTTDERLSGFRLALESHDIPFDEAWVYRGHGRSNEGYQAALAISSETSPPSAVIAFNSLMADGIILGLQDVAPQFLDHDHIEVATIGYSPVAHVCRSSRYYIDQRPRQIGEEAVILLLNIIAGEGPSDPKQRVIVNAHLTEFRPPKRATQG